MMKEQHLLHNYYISKDNKSGEIVYLEYDKEGYKVTPKRKKKDAIEVNKIVFVSPKLTEKLINLGTNAIFLNGEVKSTKRFEEYEKIKTENNKCIVAIDKIASTGLSISRLFNLVFIDYGKAFTKTNQSVGRGLRLPKDKDFVEIYDISSTTKYSKKHFNERIHYYDEKKYPFRILNIDKWK